MMCMSILHCETIMHRHFYDRVSSLRATTSLKRGSQRQAVDCYHVSAKSNSITCMDKNTSNRYKGTSIATLLFVLMIGTLIPSTSCFSTETHLVHSQWRQRPIRSLSLDKLRFIMALQDGNLDIATNHQANLSNLASLMHQRFQAAPPSNQADVALEDGPTSLLNSSTGSGKVLSSTTAGTAADSIATTWVAPSATLGVTTSSYLESSKARAATTSATNEIV